MSTQTKDLWFYRCTKHKAAYPEGEQCPGCAAEARTSDHCGFCGDLTGVKVFNEACPVHGFSPDEPRPSNPPPSQPFTAEEIIARAYLRLQAADVPRGPWHWEVSGILMTTPDVASAERPQYFCPVPGCPGEHASKRERCADGDTDARS